MTSEMPVPEALCLELQRWHDEGRKEQLGVPWHREKWQGAFPQHADFLGSLPDRIDRTTVCRVAQSAHRDPVTAVHSLIATVAWGHGRKAGRGKMFLNNVLGRNEPTQLGALLTEAADRVRRDGGPATYEWLSPFSQRRSSGSGRIVGLGTSYATKYLFFCAPDREHNPVLILDNDVARWLKEHADWDLQLEGSKRWTRHYTSYVENAVRWAEQLAVQPGDIEFLIFSAAHRGRPGSDWNQGQGVSRTSPRAKVAGVRFDEWEDAVLERLGVLESNERSVVIGAMAAVRAHLNTSSRASWPQQVR